MGIMVNSICLVGLLSAIAAIVEIAGSPQHAAYCRDAHTTKG